MPRCKRDGCREQAVYHRRWGHKQYCVQHGHAYADKRDKALKVRATLPDCSSGVSMSCEGKVGPQRAERGETTCRVCEEKQMQIDAHYRKHIVFERAETVEELKNWIREYVL